MVAGTMLWRLLWSLGRGVRLPGGGGGGGGGTVALCRHRPVGPARPCDGDPSPTEDSRHGRHQQHRSCGCGNLLHHCTSFTLSALAVLAVELVKHVRRLSSVQPGGGDVGFYQLEGHLAVLPQSQHSVPPTAPSACSSGKEEQHFFVGDDSGYAPKNPSSKTSQPKQYQHVSETGDILFLSSTSSEPDSCLLRLQGNLEEESSVGEAASQVQQVFQASISVASNILGLENMHDKQWKTAFSCFKLAADQNHSKAQFNVGLCYEHGRGTKKNVAKAVFYYQRAARQGHPMAQHRYTQCLLRHCPRADKKENVQDAVGLLDEGAAAGLTEGTRVSQNSPTARQRYQEAAAASSKAAQERIRVMAQKEIAATQIRDPSPLAAKTSSSSPCLQLLDQLPTSHFGQPAFGLLHSWSTGSLRDAANSSANCMPTTAFPDNLKLQSLAWSSGVAVG
ncbi:death ligand signal enhancer isoform X2 [Podarcis raffonei]|uniref:death ligand signal enhancer isoform X2 n=1 Tax=Podarcis raffonei TaxID=65483 RepID=UPI0023294D06|nr:death ligand signal enhancer isoform X2 [Podarcis raffonei]